MQRGEFEPTYIENALFLHITFPLLNFILATSFFVKKKQKVNFKRKAINVRVKKMSL